MSIINSIAAWFMKQRMHQIEIFMKYPLEVQHDTFQQLLRKGKETSWGKQHHFTEIQQPDAYKARVPLQDYNSLKPFIDRVRQGETNVLWPGETKYFAKSSGTTNDKSKFIPVTTESLEDCHYRGGKDMVSIYCSNYPDTQLFDGKNLALGGSRQTNMYEPYESYTGDLSAIVMQNLPGWAEFFRAPSIEIALLSEWEEKLEKMARATMVENVTSIAGVPSWMLVLLKHILTLAGKTSISEVWPNLEVFYHGGISFVPYRQQFKDIVKSDKLRFLELYNASEGFFGIQDQKDASDLLLMLDYGIYYEFIPLDEQGEEQDTVLGLEAVQLNQVYSLVISTNGGLWRYRLGDTIRFTNLLPYRFKIAGRTKAFINAFGEELMVDNADQGLQEACSQTGALIKDYTAAPIFMDAGNTGGHEWLIEFEREPNDLGLFAQVLDDTLKKLNSDYEAKRYRDMAIRFPIINVAKPDTFYRWLKDKGKLGGQYKVPRLSNNRTYLDELLRYSN